MTRRRGFICEFCGELVLNGADQYELRFELISVARSGGWSPRKHLKDICVPCARKMHLKWQNVNDQQASLFPWEEVKGDAELS